MQLASSSTGWLELPNGQRWNPSHSYKFNTRSPRRPWWVRFRHRLTGGVMPINSEQQKRGLEQLRNIRRKYFSNSSEAAD
jgi:hypothetical protein